MNKYLVYFAAQWQILFQYRVDIAVYAVAAVISPLVGMALWIALSGSGANLVYTASELKLYFLFVILVNTLAFAWKGWYISEDINRGNITKYLVKPIPLVTEYFTGAMSQKAYQFIYMGIILVTLGFLLNVGFPSNFFSPVTLGAFLISLIMATLISFLLDFCIGLLTFWVHEIDSFMGLFGLALNFFSGRLIPLVFLPLVLREVSIYLPFRYMISLPAEIAIGKVYGGGMIYALGIQFIWLVLSYGIYRFLLRQGFKKYSSYGS